MKGIVVTVFKYWDINTMQRHEDICFSKKIKNFALSFVQCGILYMRMHLWF